MKKNWKYVSAELFVANFLILFVSPIVRIPIMDLELSMKDIVQIGNGMEESEVWLGFESLLKEYMTPFFYLVIVLGLMCGASALGCILLDWKEAYKLALAGVIATNVFAVACIGAIDIKMRDIGEIWGIGGTEGIIELCLLPVCAWLVINLGIVAISVWGIVKTPSRSAVHTARRGEAPISFRGALRGLGGIYQGKIYPFQENCTIYFAWDGQQLYVSEMKEKETLAEIYYVNNKEQYCVIPEGRLLCFLESGQPLGEKRCYHLKRGTRIFFDKRGPAAAGVMFELV